MIDLFNQTKHGHWNVRGPSFIALHELFDDVGERVEKHCDELTERVVALGGSAAGTTRQAADLGDPTTSDLFTEVSLAIDKDLWSLKAQLQA